MNRRKAPIQFGFIQHKSGLRHRSLRGAGTGATNAYGFYTESKVKALNKAYTASLIPLTFPNLRINYPCSESPLVSIENVSSLSVPFAPHTAP
jgi:hypothetical protein